MRIFLFALTALFSGCGSYGLDATDTGAMASQLGIDPLGEIDFGAHDLGAPKSARTDVVMFVDGEQPLAIIDVFLEGGSSDIFSLSDELPLPLLLQPGVDFPVSLRFSPDTSGTFRGELTVMIDDGTDDGSYINRPIVGEGCTDSDC